MATSDQLASIPTTATRSFLSRKLARRPAEGEHQTQHDDPKGPLGLTTLFEPPDPAVPVTADVVFVHGLNGGSQSTWSKDNRTSHFWPKEWLPLDDAFDGVRIHSFGYPSGLARESVLNVRDFASSLLAAVKDSPSMNKRTNNAPLIFITHSMGGLVTKLAYILGRQDPAFKSVVDRVCSILFLATPHRGAAIAQTLSNLLTFVPGSGARPFVNDLLPLSPMLQAINEDFPRVCGDLQLFSFFESRPMNVGLRKLLIVEKNNAVMNLANERRILLDADHRSAAKFASPDESAYLAVRNALAAVVSAQRSAANAQMRLLAQEGLAILDSFLGVSDAPEDEIMALDSVRLPGSGKWLAEKPSYKSWRDRSGSNNNFLWLQGRPGAGKSVLAGQVINELRDAGVDCSFFFFQAPDNTKSRANACLRSLAWQMARLHPKIASRLFESKYEDGPIDKVDHHPAWRRLFMSGILKLRLDRPQFWIIDAMDECRDSIDMVQFLLHAQESWPLSILVTCRDPVDVHLTTSTGPHICTETILDEDITQDISLFVESSKHGFPCLQSEQWPDPSTIASHIVKNSGGCFLWASIMCSEMWQVVGEREIGQALDSVPPLMDALYSKLLDNMRLSRARWGTDIAKALIVWATYAFRPLTTIEIQEAIEIEIGGKMSSSIEDIIAKFSGHFLYVDKNAKVQLFHSTAREFLIQKGDQTPFTTTKADGHYRLAVVCLQALTLSITAARQTLPLGSDPDRTAVTIRGLRRLTLERTQANWAATSFTLDYASLYLFQHLNSVPSPGSDIFQKLADFLGSPNVLLWIEFHARNGNLHPVYQAGKTINSLRAAHLPLLGLMPSKQRNKQRGNQPLLLLEKWGDDLIYLVTKFGTHLRGSPKVIHHLIPAFAPFDSAIRTTFTNPIRGISVHGLSQRSWDDCLTTISFPKIAGLSATAAGHGYFAVGMGHPEGIITIYDDQIFQETYLLHHGEDVCQLAFSDSGGLLASAGDTSVRIWCTGEGREVSKFKIPSKCAALAFAEEDHMLLVATDRNQVVVWDVRNKRFYRNKPLSCPLEWDADLADQRVPVSVAIGRCSGLLAVNYKDRDIFLWDYIDETLSDDTVGRGLVPDLDFLSNHDLATAMLFSQAPGASLLAVSYCDGSMYVYDTEYGVDIARAVGVNAQYLSSSPNGATLATLDAYGNLTLFDFGSLKVLSYIPCNTPTRPQALVFTADSRRLIEIYDRYCRVWQPPVLRADLREEDRSELPSVSTDLPYVQAKSHAPHVNISAMVCLQSSDEVFYGMDDGSVHVCDLKGKTETRLLFVQNPVSPIRVLAVDEEEHLLVCGNLTVTARKVLRHQGRRQGQTTWEVQEPLIDTSRRTSPPELEGILTQAFVSGKHSRLLSCTNTVDVLLAITEDGECARIAQLPGSPTPRWAVHPTNKDILIRMEDSGFGIYSWEKLEHIRSIPAPVVGTFFRLTPLNSPFHFITSSTLNSDSSKTKYQLWNAQSISAAPGNPTTPLTLPDTTTVKVLIGTFASRLIFFTTDGWIASFDLAQPTPESLLRHFFIPIDWTIAGHMLVIGLGRNGEILFARGDELAVVKKGLEGTEDPEARVDLRRGGLQPAAVRAGLLSRDSVSEPAGGARGAPGRRLGGAAAAVRSETAARPETGEDSL
ncbi:hypothetical protein QBC39DRAFT_311254 [Podospora conica]|nr:hypothetical protein QBC39DRAFT_311254 [Schizothecium conicum]